jgi:serine/threonine-protein phosphatase PGAM5
VTRYVHLARHGEAVDEQSGLTTAGREQAGLLGQRMAAVPLAAIHHSPLARAVQTAELVAAARADAVPLRPSDLVGDLFPPVGDPPPAAFAPWMAGVSAAERETGARLARAATARFAVPSDAVTHELIVTHAFVIGWFVVHALGAPDERWRGLNHCNCAVTTIRYAPGRPPALTVFNDQSHLPPALRWTGFPPDLTAP